MPKTSMDQLKWVDESYNRNASAWADSTREADVIIGLQHNARTTH